MNRYFFCIGRLLLGLFFCFLWNMNINAQELKVYDGPYTPFNGGHVTYQYREAPDGSRIFEGDFEFQGSSTTSPQRAKGQFKNDRQVGNWTWEFESGHIIEISFSEDGCIFRCKGLGRTKQSYINGTIGTILRNPRSITSFDLYDAGIGRVLRMKWDTMGRQSGPWQVKMKKDEPLYTSNQMGGKWYYVKESTGDKVEYSDLWGLQSAINQAEEWIWSELKPCIMRSTFKKQ